jgi:hypothetical protein
MGGGEEEEKKEMGDSVRIPNFKIDIFAIANGRESESKSGFGLVFQL